MNGDSNSSYHTDLVITCSGLILGAGILCSFVFFPLDVTITFILLLGVWGGDALLKRAFGLGINSAFADLSFASLVFVGSKGVSLITEGSLSVSNQSSVINAFVFTVVLGLFWILNLFVCREIDFSKTKEERRHTALILSAFISSLSFIIVLTIQWNKMI